MQGNAQKRVVALDGVTATTTSSAIEVQQAKKISLELTRANHGSGSSAFSVTGSIDGGTTFTTIKSMVEDLTNTNAQGITRVASITLNANGVTLAAIDMSLMAYTHIKVVVTETTDGTHTAKVLVEY